MVRDRRSCNSLIRIDRIPRNCSRWIETTGKCVVCNMQNEHIFGFRNNVGKRVEAAAVGAETA